MTNTAKTQKLLLPALILTTPFLVFLDYNEYCFSCAETWIALSGLIVLAIICSVIMLLSGWIGSGLVLAALVTAFIEFQFAPRNLPNWVDEWMALLFFAGTQTFVLCLFLRDKLCTIATAVFFTFFMVTLFQLVIPREDKDSLFEHHGEAPHARPRIIHLILDEHIGIEGIPIDIEGGLATRNLITQFYLKNGFQLFGGAFSRHLLTHTSIGNMVNFAAGSNSTKLIGGHGPYNLLHNKYFELLSETNYHIEVLSLGWIDFCSESTVVISSCIEKDWSNLKNLVLLPLPVSQKLQVLYSRYLNQSTIVGTSISAFQSRFPSLTASIPQWAWVLKPEATMTTSFNILADLKVLWKDILSLPRGRVLFAHLPIPHYPYVALSDCSIRPPHRFFLWDSSGLLTNTTVSRKERYQQYFEQLQCIYLRLDELFDKMRAAGTYDDSIILLHGDHGSRIVMTAPNSKNQHQLTKHDLVDGFSTLFAMKLPQKSGGYDNSPWPLEQLLARFAFEAGLTPTNILPGQSQPYVYLTADDNKEFIRIPYAAPN